MEKAENCNRKEAERVYTVCLEGLSFHAFHGCREEEKINGNSFCVDFSGKYASIAGSTDNLEDAISYGDVYRAIAEVMNGERRNLLEYLANAILKEICGRFPGFIYVNVTVSKKNPPVAGPCEWSRVSAEWKKQ